LAQFSNYVIDRYGTPNLSALTSCSAPDIAEPAALFGSFLFNDILRLQVNDQLRRLIVIFGRRTEQAIRDYRTGRQLLKLYVERLPETNTHMLTAMQATTHFEHCIASTCQAGALLGEISRVIAPDEDHRHEDDRYARLKAIWNRSKHFDEDLAGGKAAKADITAPVWITNTGVSCARASITFDELHGCLQDLYSAWTFFAEELAAKVAGGPS